MITRRAKPVRNLTLSIGLGISLVVAGCSQANTPNDALETTQESTFVVNHVDAEGAKTLLASQPETVVLDIRTPQEISEGHIEGAVFADFNSADFEAQLSNLDRTTPYIVHCRSGGRSTKALSTLEKLGFTNITHLDGGIKAWKQESLQLIVP